MTDRPVFLFNSTAERAAVFGPAFAAGLLAGHFLWRVR